MARKTKCCKCKCMKKWIEEICKENCKCDCSESEVKALQMQMKNRAGEVIGNETDLTFDTTLVNTIGDVIDFDGKSFVIKESGLYNFDWRLSVVSTISATNNIITTLYVNDVEYEQECFVLQYGQISGNSIINIEKSDLPMTISLKCFGSDKIQFVDLSTQANIAVTKLK